MSQLKRVSLQVCGWVNQVPWLEQLLQILSPMINVEHLDAFRNDPVKNQIIGKAWNTPGANILD